MTLLLKIVFIPLVTLHREKAYSRSLKIECTKRTKYYLPQCS